MNEKNYFPFYLNWADMINEYMDEDGDVETAKLLALAIVRYATVGEIMDLGDRHLQRMFESCLTVGLDTAAKHYADGQRGGRPTKLTAEDNTFIAQAHLTGQTAKQIAASFGVSDDTIRRSDGWKNPQKYTQNYTQNAKPSAPQKYTHTQNQKEKEEEKEDKKEKYAGAVRALSSFTSGDDLSKWLENGGQIEDDMNE